MTGLPRLSDEALAPVRASLSASAAQQAEVVRMEAREQAHRIDVEAQEQAGRSIAAAVAEGRATARTDAHLRSARVRREAQGIVLRQQDALRQMLQRQVRDAAVGLRRDPRYPDMLARLTAECHTLLGPDAIVTEHPEGGVVGESGSRRVDLSLPTLATRTLDSMLREVSELWTR